MRRGFTVVELLITLAVMAILLVLAVVSMRGVQLNARDSERKSDIATLGRALEVRYERGNSLYTGLQPNPGGRGSYPSHNEVWDAVWTHGQEHQYMFSVFPSASHDSFIDPSGDYSLGLVCIFEAGAPDCQVPRPQSRIDQTVISGSSKPQYAYEPMKSDGSICHTSADICTQYNLYWKSEVSGTVIKYKSQHR